MYLDLRTDTQSVLLNLIEKYMHSENAVQVTINKRDDLYRITLVCAVEPEPPTG